MQVSRGGRPFCRAPAACPQRRQAAFLELQGTNEATAQWRPARFKRRAESRRDIVEGGSEATQLPLVRTLLRTGYPGGVQIASIGYLGGVDAPWSQVANDAASSPRRGPSVKRFR